MDTVCVPIEKLGISQMAGHGRADVFIILIYPELLQAYDIISRRRQVLGDGVDSLRSILRNIFQPPTLDLSQIFDHVLRAMSYQQFKVNMLISFSAGLDMVSEVRNKVAGEHVHGMTRSVP